MSELLLAAPGFVFADEDAYDFEDHGSCQWLRPALSPRRFLEEQELFAAPQSWSNFTQPQQEIPASQQGSAYGPPSAPGAVTTLQAPDRPDSARSLQSFASGTASRICDSDDDGRDHHLADELLSDFFSNLPGAPPVTKRVESIPNAAIVKRPLAQRGRGPRAPALKVGEWQNADLAEHPDASYQEAEVAVQIERTKPKVQKRQAGKGLMESGKTGKGWWNSSWPADRGPWEHGEDTAADREPKSVKLEEDSFICPAEYQELATQWRHLSNKVWEERTMVGKTHHAPVVYGHDEATDKTLATFREWQEEFFGSSGKFSSLPIVNTSNAFERGDYRRKTMSGRTPLGVKMQDLDQYIIDDESEEHDDDDAQERAQPSSPRYGEGVRINSFAEWHEEFFGNFGYVSSTLPSDPQVGGLRPASSRGPEEERRFRAREAEEEAVICKEREESAIKMQAAFRGKKVRNQRRSEKEAVEAERRAEDARRRREESLLREENERNPKNPKKSRSRT